MSLLLVAALTSCGGTGQHEPSSPSDSAPVPNQATAVPADSTSPEIVPPEEFILVSGAPLIHDAPVCMSCTVEDIYETEGFESFICKIAATYAEESVLTAEGKIDYRTLKPVLFEFPTYEYLKTGDVLGKCRSWGNKEAAK